MVVTQTGCAVPPKNNGGKYSAISLCFVRFCTFFLNIEVLGIFVYVWKVRQLIWKFVMALLSSFYSVCTLVCLTSVCVWRQYNYIILMCGTYLYFVSCFFFFKYYWLELLYTIIYLLLLQQLWVINPQSSIFKMKTLHCCNLLPPRPKHLYW